MATSRLVRQVVCSGPCDGLNVIGDFFFFVFWPLYQSQIHYSPPPSCGMVCNRFLRIKECLSCPSSDLSVNDDPETRTEDSKGLVGKTEKDKM